MSVYAPHTACLSRNLTATSSSLCDDAPRAYIRTFPIHASFLLKAILLGRLYPGSIHGRLRARAHQPITDPNGTGADSIAFARGAHRYINTQPRIGVL